MKINKHLLKLVIHGGIAAEKLTPHSEIIYHHALKEALVAGYHKLLDGESSLNAAQKAVEVLEDTPIFNAGYGSVLTEQKTVKKSVNCCLKKLTALGGKGGIIALSRKGNIAILFNTTGMYRGYITSQGMTTKIYKK